MAFFKVEAESIEEIKNPQKEDPAQVANKIRNSLMVHQKKVKKKK